jgi:tetratricopeptide (TPR) repeat protein
MKMLRPTEEDPQLDDAWNNKGKVLRKVGRDDKAITIHPQYANAWNKKGEALKSIGRSTEADAAFAKAKELGYTD